MKRRGQGRQHTTGLAFGNRGDKLVATYHADHAYSFDTTRGVCHTDPSDAAGPNRALAYALCSRQQQPSSTPQNGCQARRRDAAAEQPASSSRLLNVE